MNEQNLEYLKDNLKYMGFGEKLYEALENKVKEGKDAFQLNLQTEVNKKPFEAVLNFRKSDSSDMYFFNNYTASLERSNGEKISQLFYLSNGKGVTAKEAYNLLDGRAVHKELTNKDNVPYKAWLQLDFDSKDKNNNYEVKQYHQNYGFDLKGAVEKLPLKELGNEEGKNNLIRSLEKGNVQSVTFEKAGISEKMFIEANPQYKTINVYDGGMKRIQSQALNEKLGVAQKPESNKLENGEEIKNKQEIKTKVKQTPADDLNGAKKKSGRRKGMSV